MTFDAKGDVCLGFFGDCYDPDLMPLPKGASVLELGCAEADWMTPMWALRPDLRLTGIDYRPVKRPGETVQADVLEYEFPRAAFDAIVSISAIEHIGLGAYGDPVNPHGDTLTMRRLATWVKPGGWVYFDVPFRDDRFVVTTNYRAYDWYALADRLLSVPTLVGVTARIFRDHGSDAPYIACLLKKV